MGKGKRKMKGTYRSPQVHPAPVLERVLADLADHPGSTGQEIAGRLNVRDDRQVFKALDEAAHAGLVQSSHIGTDLLQWSRT